MSELDQELEILRNYMYNNCIYHRMYRDVSDWPSHSWPCQAWSEQFGVASKDFFCVFGHGLVSKNWLLS
jgi:hypothetical protein